MKWREPGVLKVSVQTICWTRACRVGPALGQKQARVQSAAGTQEGEPFG